MQTTTPKVELLKRMHAGRQELYATLDRIPEELMDEIALYDNWTIKDFIAHIGWWEQTTADRIAAWRRGEEVPPITQDMIEAMNAHFLTRYHDMPLYEVRAMEASAFAALEHQVIEATDAEIFDPHRFPGRQSALLDLIAGDSYEHYAEHLPDVLVWMQKHGID